MEEYDLEMLYKPETEEESAVWVKLTRGYFDEEPEKELLEQGLIRKVPPFQISPTAISEKHNFVLGTEATRWPYGPSVVSWMGELVDLLGREGKEDLSDFQIIELLVKANIKN